MASKSATTVVLLEEAVVPIPSTIHKTTPTTSTTLFLREDVNNVDKVVETAKTVDTTESAAPTLPLFQELPESYEPTTDWLDGSQPQHPHFDNAARIQNLTRALKDSLIGHMLDGCKLLLQREVECDNSKKNDSKNNDNNNENKNENKNDTGHTNNCLLSGFDIDRTLWTAAISVVKYGVIYLATRAECRQTFLPAVAAAPARFSAIADFLACDGNAVRAINYGVHSWVTTGAGVQVEHRTALTPPQAIASVGENHVAVRAVDFPAGHAVDHLEAIGVTATNGIVATSAEPPVLWDLHDFSHQACAALCPQLFGNKYSPHLVALPARLTALIRSPRMRTADPRPRCSDGLVFSEFLTSLFTAAVPGVPGPLLAREADRDGNNGNGTNNYTVGGLTEQIANHVSDYLLGRRSLQHLTTGAQIRMEEPIKAEQLAVLSQNKAYELTASEMEQRVLTRGGPAGDNRDELDGLGAADRISHLATSRAWMYFEARNTIKHRAHKLAYLKTIDIMLEAQQQQQPVGRDERLLRATRDLLAYKGWDDAAAGGVVAVDLWRELGAEKDGEVLLADYF